MERIRPAPVEGESRLFDGFVRLAFTRLEPIWLHGSGAKAITQAMRRGGLDR